LADRTAGATLRAVDISAGYGARPVIEGVSVIVRPGEIAAIVGPNGSGKSTLLKSLAGVIPVLSGRVLLDERDITNLAAEDIARIGVGYVPQIDDVFAALTVRENLEMGGYLLPTGQVRARIEHVVTVFPKLGSLLGRRAGGLSGGERKMLAMSRCLMLEPAVFILDEPTANLAPVVARMVLEEQVGRLAASGASILIVEQRAKAVLAICDHAYVLGGGRLRMAGTRVELAADPAFVHTFLGGGHTPQASGN
jgi:ABC-type branched-subunit amino acid transport system ATPase component